MEEMEEKLQKNVPLAEELQKELEELSTNYAKQKEIYNGICRKSYLCNSSKCKKRKASNFKIVFFFQLLILFT